MDSVIHPQYEIVVEDVEHLRHPSGPLLARLYLPSGPGPVPLVTHIHGGAWCRGSRLDEDVLNQALARAGIAVAALDFRMPPIAAYPASLADINYAVRWLKQNARKFGSRPELVSLMGVSSGGHQAMLAAMRPQEPRYASLALADDKRVDAEGVEATVRSVVMGWPVIDPAGRYQYALEWQASGSPYPEAIDRVIPDHIRYWGTQDAMKEGSPLRVLERQESVRLPRFMPTRRSRSSPPPRTYRTFCSRL